ncbi:mechanosensitive ion channel family protein [Actinospongicola halichondriae]|uniref:mechanosensitive ion channel family protein n=1 Tax=Actinospongicola halichondriae TaxID=3236844 RepID=UPI003D3F2C4A
MDLAENDLLRIGVGLGVVIVAYIVSRVTRRVLEPRLTARQTPSFGRVVSRLVGWGIVSVAVIFAVTLASPSVKPVDFIAGLGVFSIALGFAFQDILSNLLAGVLLIIRQPFQQGDQIEVNGFTGTVEGITIRETTLKTFDGQRVIVPNADVYQSAIQVLTAFGERRTSLEIGVGYDDDLGVAEDVILDACRGVEGVLADPEPQAYLIGLGDNAVVFDLRYWTDPHQADVRRVEHLVFRAVKERLDAEGLDMPFPVRTIEAAPSLVAALRRELDDVSTDEDG